jgi:hypothetical protein
MNVGDTLDLTTVRPKGPNDPAPYFLVIGASGLLASPSGFNPTRTTYASTVAERVTLLLVSEPSSTPGRFQFYGFTPGTRMEGTLDKSSPVAAGGFLYKEILIHAMAGAFYQVDASSPTFVTQLKAFGPDGKPLKLDIQQSGNACQAGFQVDKDGTVKLWLANQGTQKPSGHWSLTVTNSGYGQ